MTDFIFVSRYTIENYFDIFAHFRPQKFTINVNFYENNDPVCKIGETIPEYLYKKV